MWRRATSSAAWCGSLASLLFVARLSGSVPGAGELLLSIIVTLSGRGGVLAPAGGHHRRSTLPTSCSSAASRTASSSSTSRATGSTRRADPARRLDDLAYPPRGCSTCPTPPWPLPAAFPAALLAWLVRYSVIIAFLAVCAFFALLSPTFLATGQPRQRAGQQRRPARDRGRLHDAAGHLGGIDLSVGTAVDMASMVFIMAMAAGLALASGLGSACRRDSWSGSQRPPDHAPAHQPVPCHALGVLFIGQSVQQLATNGGQPIYLVTSAAEAFAFIGHGRLLGIPWPPWVVGLAYVAIHLLLNDTPFGRHVRAPSPAGRSLVFPACVRAMDASWSMPCARSLCGLAGIIVSCTVRSYVLLSGNAFLLDAIGATFIGTTLRARHRPNVLGTPWAWSCSARSRTACS
ncbi:MAG: hypothetical protein U1E17_04255 [Geminicoccaceae bacterium]